MMKGTPPHTTAEAARACVVAVAIYGAHVWYTGHRQGRHITAIDRALKTAVRAVLPVWKTDHPGGGAIPGVRRTAGRGSARAR